MIGIVINMIIDTWFINDPKPDRLKWHPPFFRKGKIYFSSSIVYNETNCRECGCWVADAANWFYAYQICREHNEIVSRLRLGEK